MKFKVIVGYIDNPYYTQTATLQDKKTLEELKNNINIAFNNGIFKIKLYQDFRKKNDYVELLREDFLNEKINK